MSLLIILEKFYIHVGILNVQASSEGQNTQVEWSQIYIPDDSAAVKKNGAAMPSFQICKCC